MAKYDVFISCKSEDYPLAGQVYDFLNDNHIRTFLASKELRKLGDAEYREAIENVLDEVEHMIVVSSNPEYAKSQWVKYEWGLFINAKNAGDKHGNILTVLSGITTKELPMGIRYVESLDFKDFKSSILHYTETEASKQRAKEAATKLEEEKLKQIQENKRKLVEAAEKYVGETSKLKFAAAKIKALKEQVGIKEIECPVCSRKNSLNDEFCRNCGWTLSPIEGIEGAEYLNINNAEAIKLQKEKIATSDVLRQDIVELQGRLAQANRTIVDIKAENQKLQLEHQRGIERLQDELKKAIDRFLNLERESGDREERYKAEIASLKKQAAAAKEEKPKAEEYVLEVLDFGTDRWSVGETLIQFLNKQLGKDILWNEFYDKIVQKRNGVYSLRLEKLTKQQAEQIAKEVRKQGAKAQILSAK